MKSLGLTVILLWLCIVPVFAANSAPTPPSTASKGETLFNTYCAGCHGMGAKGTAHGPPFLDKIYEPNHHADIAFYRAPEMGVRAHHWKFGDMPKVPGVTKDDLTLIIAYIRELQKQAGIF